MKTHKTGKPWIRPGVSRMTWLALGIVALALPQAALAQGVTPPSVPAALELPVPSQAFLLGHGVGTQNYVCQPSGPFGRVAWTLFTPQATLFDDAVEQLTTHFSSPNPAEGGIVRVTWQDSSDTSRVWGRVVASATVTANAIPWLLVQIVGTQTGPTGGNSLTGATFIHRVNTEGGLAPSSDCDSLTDVGHKAFIPYAADYFFYRS